MTFAIATPETQAKLKPAKYRVHNEHFPECSGAALKIATRTCLFDSHGVQSHPANGVNDRLAGQHILDFGFPFGSAE